LVGYPFHIYFCCNKNIQLKSTEYLHQFFIQPLLKREISNK
jgi:hypothetical protein